METLPHELIGLILEFVPYIYNCQMKLVAKIWYEYAKRKPLQIFSETIKDYIGAEDYEAIAFVLKIEPEQALKLLKSSTKFSEFVVHFATNSHICELLVNDAINSSDLGTIESLDKCVTQFSLNNVITAFSKKYQLALLEESVRMIGDYAGNDYPVTKNDYLIYRIITKYWKRPCTSALIEIAKSNIFHINSELKYPQSYHLIDMVHIVLNSADSFRSPDAFTNFHFRPITSQDPDRPMLLYNEANIEAIPIMQEHIDDLVTLIKMGAFNILRVLPRELLLALNNRYCLTEAFEFLPAKISSENLNWFILCFRAGGPSSYAIDNPIPKIRREIIMAAKCAGRSDLKRLINQLYGF